MLNLPLYRLSLMVNKLKEILNTFTPVSLDEIDEVKLMDRKDVKFTITSDKIFPNTSQFAG